MKDLVNGALIVVLGILLAGATAVLAIVGIFWLLVGVGVVLLMMFAAYLRDRIARRRMGRVEGDRWRRRSNAARWERRGRGQ
jgi:hypothetical protein